MSGDCDVEDVAALLEDETVRSILTETSVQPMSATELSERCAASKATIYRRLDDLRACDLVVERTRPDPDEGHHRQIYEPTLRRVQVELRNGDLDLSIDRRETMSDRFTRLVEEM